MEEKQLLRRNLAVVALLVLLMAAVLLLGRLLPDRLTPNSGVLLPDPTAAPPAQETADTPPGEDAVCAYLVVTVGEATYEPIPLRAPGRFTVTRGEKINIIEVTADSMRMAESSCDNQDCIYQGTVSLDNMEDRALQNMVICLPNEVTLQLYTPEQLARALTAVPEETHAP